MRAIDKPQHLIRSTKLPFEYSIVRSVRKTLAVYVRAGDVEVRAPRHVGDAEVREFVHKHRRWIVGKLAHKKDQAQQMLEIRNGATIFYKARNLNMVFQEAQVDGVRVTEKEFIIRGKKLDKKGATIIMEAWLLQQAKDYLPARTRALATHMGLGAKLKDVVFRKTKSKWGHCTAAGCIQFNWLIMLTPDAIIDYMICHEACHLRYMNHSPRYWQLVATVCPDYRQYVKWLKQHEHRFWPPDTRV